MAHIPHSTTSVPGAVDADRPSERAVSGPAAGPVRLRPPGGVGRIVAIDVVRGLAVLGMVAVHTVGALSPVVDAVVVGHTSVLFFLVAGVTVGLTASRRRADGAVEVTGRALLVPRAVVRERSRSRPSRRRR
jgi:predicted acyltransferase